MTATAAPANDKGRSGRTAATGQIVLFYPGPADEAKQRAEQLRGAGYVVSVAGRMSGTDLRRYMDRGHPEAVVIDLSRVPSEGEGAALHLLSYRPTRQVPIIFVDGAPEKVARVRKNVPEAVFTTAALLTEIVAKALAAGPRQVAPGPRSVFDPYRGVSLAKKLGIKPGSVVALVRPPDGFEHLLPDLPTGAELRKDNRGRRDLTILFVTAVADLDAEIPRALARLGPDGLWIAWPKKTSGRSTDLSHSVVQRAGLAAGLMDYKLCSIDETWSALRFTRRS